MSNWSHATLFTPGNMISFTIKPDKTKSYKGIFVAKNETQILLNNIYDFNGHPVNGLENKIYFLKDIEFMPGVPATVEPSTQEQLASYPIPRFNSAANNERNGQHEEESNETMSKGGRRRSKKSKKSKKTKKSKRSQKRRKSVRK
jgi:hypothetical protein